MTDSIRRARQIIQAESEALAYVAQSLDESFDEVVVAILALRGKVVVTGVGKSGLIGAKIAATLSSTGTPAIFMHSVEAVMGDLGILSGDDILIAISNSGETNEVVNVVAAAEQVGTPAVAMTKNPESSLAQMCRYHLTIVVDREAGDLGLAPTTSTTVTLALGDALALVLSERKNFTPEQFHTFHPGGSLGRRLAVKVADIMIGGKEVPKVRTSATLRDAIALMTQKKPMGVVVVTDADDRLSGIFTDGDLRRVVARRDLSPGYADEAIEGYMVAGPTTVEADVLASEALRIMEAKGITSLPIVDSLGHVAGIAHLHDILGRGKFIL